LANHFIRALMIKKIISFLFSIIPFLLVAQSNGQLGAWNVHLPYVKNTSIAAIGHTVYCGSASGLFSYNESNGELERISKTQGLSDVEVKLLKVNPNNGMLFIAYTNGNIDLMLNGEVVNMPQILQRSIIGKKSVNEVTFYNGRAYVACSFGIVVIDVNKAQILDSYQNIGANGATLEIFDVAIFNNFIYATTSNGVYRASLTSGNLSDFKFWTLFKASTKSNKMESFNNKLFVEVDSVLNEFDGNNWKALEGIGFRNVLDIQVANNKMVVCSQQNVLSVDKNNTIDLTGSQLKNAAVILPNNRYAVVDDFYGLQVFPGGKFNGIDFVTPNGPFSSLATDFKFINNTLYAAGGYAPLFNEGFKRNGIYLYDGTNWRNTRENGLIPDTILDILTLAYDAQNGKLYGASYGKGLLKMDLTGRLETVYNKTNSALQEVFAGSCRVASVAMDFENNLWLTNHSSGLPICVLTNDGTLKCFSVGTAFGGNNAVTAIAIDDLNNKWIAHSRDGGLMVYNHGLDVLNGNDDSYKVLTKDKGNGEMPSNQVNCITKDKKGEMWVGTNNGLCIFSNPDLIFESNNRSFDARQIVIRTGLVNSNFLGGENITAIKVDGANRKWIGTGNGVWLVAPDGYTVLQNFTTKNSPLLDNNILAIGINDNNGEVFFGTSKGIVSYMSDATEADKSFKGVEIYPNPVRPNFDGEVSIKGLAENVNVKITDAAGNLVAEATSNGGFATWNGRNFAGNRVATGVYIVFAANKDGSKSIVGKLLFIQ
jgi:hypothetical protein